MWGRVRVCELTHKQNGGGGGGGGSTAWPRGVLHRNFFFAEGIADGGVDSVGAGEGV